ncbi:TIGR02444 family protein [Shewanella sp. 6_MG-2023]|uniref:TIGR02444 family protein n=1 Tax=Shewanella sp. 6_MG-2023 TaxID=3062660 RepID=UPI0026E11727|nr:TIGR02444 family protein [Shewanella sp. 6_MG-2023]MDO6618036.1 TIGR02444 family protein [Shewanella sp. 6_MG-2023]
MQQFNSLLWRECESQYAIEPKRYISLQDAYQVNINMLLLAQYLDKKGYLLPLVQWQALAATINDWDTKVVNPYRTLRRLAKEHIKANEYQQMLDIELMLERKSQQMLLTKLNTVTPEIKANQHCENENTDNYLSLFGINHDDFKNLHAI